VINHALVIALLVINQLLLVLLVLQVISEPHVVVSVHQIALLELLVISLLVTAHQGVKSDGKVLNAILQLFKHALQDSGV